MNNLGRGPLGDASYQQEGHDGPVSLHWLILGNLFKTYDPEEGLKLVAMSSNKKISKYLTK